MKLQLPRGSFMTPLGEIFEAHRLIRLNQSWAIILPKLWVELFAKERWVEVIYEKRTQEFRIRPLSQEKLEVIYEWLNNHKGDC